MSTQPKISHISIGRNASPIGIGQERPRLGWRFEPVKGTPNDYEQSAYEIKITRSGSSNTYSEKSSQCVDVAWPEKETPLKSRERCKVAVRTCGNDGTWSEWKEIDVEASLFSESDWKADFISTDIVPPSNLAKRPFYTRTSFTLGAKDLEELKKGGGRVYATALGAYDLYLNGKRVGDHVLAPGWQTYNHRLHFQTYVVPAEQFKVGENVLAAVVGEGWYAGHLTWKAHLRNLWGTEIGVRVQMELPGKSICSDTNWKWSYGPILSSELYDGEEFDGTLIDPTWSSKISEGWRSVKAIQKKDSTKLIAPEAPPIRKLHELKPVSTIKSPKGRTIIDFGQNISGWVKISPLPAKKADEMTTVVTLRFAEVLDKGEIGMRPLRDAKATDNIHLGEKEIPEWEPTFTTHGFRYVEVTGYDLDPKTMTAVVVYSDMERTADFGCSHEMVTKLHSNVLWGLRGNFVGLPTDCPQRDERLGWTGDINVFTPTASILYDTHGFLSNWLHDLAADQMDNDGVPPVVSPVPVEGLEVRLYDTFDRPFPQSVWADVIAMGPENLYKAFGSTTILEELFENMCVWIDKGIPRRECGLWDPPNGFQFGDWLDPRAPPEDAAAAMTDPYLVADAYLVGVLGVTRDIAQLLGRKDIVSKYSEEHDRLRKEFQKEYVSPNGRLASDSQTAVVLSLQFGLLEKEQEAKAAERLVYLIKKNKYRIGTGFAGTPVILNLLAEHNQLKAAYSMLEETECPSWLYPITMGATTIWERWDSMLPNGEINPGEMTSFNHYALGSVASFLYSVVAGISALEPGWKKIKIHPQPGGSLTSAWAWHVTPYGKASVKWEVEGGKLNVHAEVPPNTTAEVILGSEKKSVGSGTYDWSVKI